MNITTPKDMEDIIPRTTPFFNDELLGKAVERLEEELRKEKKGKGYYTIGIEVKLSSSERDEIRELYLDSGWPYVWCYPTKSRPTVPGHPDMVLVDVFTETGTGLILSLKDIDIQ